MVACRNRSRAQAPPRHCAPPGCPMPPEAACRIALKGGYWTPEKGKKTKNKEDEALRLEAC
eukprot:scaffold41791_cov29-Tisochrysis_lutea.AAC.1